MTPLTETDSTLEFSPLLLHLLPLALNKPPLGDSVEIVYFRSDIDPYSKTQREIVLFTSFSDTSPVVPLVYVRVTKAFCR